MVVVSSELSIKVDGPSMMAVAYELCYQIWLDSDIKENEYLALYRRARAGGPGLRPRKFGRGNERDSGEEPRSTVGRTVTFRLQVWELLNSNQSPQQRLKCLCSTNI
jgi:hypothetical protein